MRWLMLLAALAACGPTAESPEGGAARARKPGLRISMDALHRMGGVPPGWQITPSPGDVASGRQAFEDFGCHSCHRIAGEKFSAKATTGVVGPELTGMGAHHPAGYFAEAILNPDAVLIVGPGYIGPDGHSTMPDYPEMTTRQLSDLVAYLGSLTTGGEHAGHVMAGAPPPTDQLERPPPPGNAQLFFVQAYEVRTGQTAAFEQWFKQDGAKRFLAYDGLVGIETFVDTTRLGKAVTSIFAFRDQEALDRFMSDRAAEALGLEFDAFIGGHDHQVYKQPPVYRVPGLSAP